MTLFPTTLHVLAQTRLYEDPGLRWFDFQLGFIAFAQVLWVFMVGACLGSLVNVLVYRIPRGLNFITPTSRCPSCQTKLTWRENVPIVGWLFLRGKCRFCRSPISPEYPIVETIVATLFAATYLTCYASGAGFMGKPFLALQPAWGMAGIVYTWPTLLILFVLFACIVAMTIIDARTFTIPAVLTNVPLVFGAATHILHAAFVQWKWNGLPKDRDDWIWTIATPGPHGWPWIGAALGAAAGLGIALVLMKLAIFKRPAEAQMRWEEAEYAKLAAQARAEGKDPEADQGENPAWMNMQYPHIRTDALRELLFLSPVVVGGLLGSVAAARFAGPAIFDQLTGEVTYTKPAPLVLCVLAGVILGYLVGGGVVWAIRIFGNLAFNKDSMGLGDVHMMAAVGACLGWTNPALALFAAAYLGLLWWVVMRVWKGRASKHLPFGPFLACGSILLFFARPLIEKLIGMVLAGHSVTLPM